MKKNKVIIVILIAAVLCIVGMIFSNSLKEKDESTEQSMVLVNYISDKFFPYADAREIENLHHYVRKGAHLTEYSCIGIILAVIARRIEKVTGRKYICFPLLVGLMVAVADEYIQNFNDRSSEVQDVIIDFGGVAAGVAAVMIICLITDKIRRRRYIG